MLGIFSSCTHAYGRVVNWVIVKGCMSFEGCFLGSMNFIGERYWVCEYVVIMVFCVFEGSVDGWVEFFFVDYFKCLVQ